MITILVGHIVLGVYLVSFSFITIYCLSQFYLLMKYLLNSKINEEKNGIGSNLPFVTIQLPLFNEKYVVERLIDNVMLMDYPNDKFEVQILDDSIDETLDISKAKADEYKNKGFNIKCINREVRSGYKAGALRDAMPFVRGELIAIFDADFMPRSDFLKKTIGALSDPCVGVVQTRWEHINQGYSLLTELLSFHLNVHFTIEQRGRYVSGYPLQFNGTAGIWRRTCIDDAGGWEADTLTEDLDLSYRAQMKGWKIKYLEYVTCPSELPADIYALKAQQFRWIKGGAENARKLLPSIWKSGFKLNQKIQATIHLMSSTLYLMVFLLGLMSAPLMFFINPLGLDTSVFSIFILPTFFLAIVYFTANVCVAWPRESLLKMIVKFVFILPVFLSLNMGLALHNSLAVAQGLWGKRTPFIRTPKYGIQMKKDDIKSKSYFSGGLNRVSIGEGILSFYFILAIYWALFYGPIDFLLFYVLLSIGYLTMFIYAVCS